MADARTGEKRADMADDDCDSAKRGKTAVAVVVATIMLEHASKNFMLLATPLGRRRYTTPRAVARRKSGGKEAGPRVTESMSVSYAGIVPNAVISCGEFSLGREGEQALPTAAYAIRAKQRTTLSGRNGQTPSAIMRHLTDRHSAFALIAWLPLFGHEPITRSVTKTGYAVPREFPGRSTA